MRFVIWGVILLVAAGLAYVRLAPGDPARWHLPVDATTDAETDNSATRVLAAEAEALTRADAHMRGLPRTEVLAGSVGEGRITYVTRSRLMGYPDYTTLDYSDGMLKAHARSRFGKSDLGVNRKRLEGLLAALQG